jgi:hypothetical protein
VVGDKLFSFSSFFLSQCSRQAVKAIWCPFTRRFKGLQEQHKGP